MPAAIRPHDVATYIEERQATHSAPDVKQQLAAVRMMFDWLIVAPAAPSNPASAVRGPTHVVKTGTTPVLEGKEWRRLIDAIPTDTVRDLRDRALIATLTYGFARVGAALKMRVEDLQSKGSGWLIRLHEKGAITRLPRRCTPISAPPASAPRRTRSRSCSARRAAKTARRCPISR
jgi:site-specific recombinase XerD